MKLLKKSLFKCSGVARVSVAALALFTTFSSFAQTITESFTSAGTHTYVVPAGVPQITIQAWGAGGGGGGVYSGFLGSVVKGAGGGGGAFASYSINVQEGDVIEITVGAGGAGGNGEADGAKGGASIVKVNGVVRVNADGGNGGMFHRGNGSTGSANGNGGNVVTGTGFPGGKGGPAKGTNGAGGGGAGGTQAAGGNGSVTSAGAGGQFFGGAGAGVTTAAGNGMSGNAPGGGGGGAFTTAGSITSAKTAIGGNGAKGEVRLVLCPLPTRPSEILGNLTPCKNSVEVFSVAQDPLVSSYSWIIPQTWSGYSTTNLIEIEVDDNPYQIGVIANNTCGSSDTLFVTVSPKTVPDAPIEIIGNAAPCQNSIQHYEIDTIADASHYEWILPNGWNGVSSVHFIDVPAGAQAGEISVIAINECGSSTPAVLAVNTIPVPVQPSVLTGSTTFCAGDEATFSVVLDETVETYTWSMPSGWSGSNTMNTMHAIAGGTGGLISVYTSNACGNSPIRSLNVTAAAGPAQPSAISGSPSICEGANVTYSVLLDPNATQGYVWSFPSDWTGGSATNSIGLVAGASSGEISVVAQNHCGASIPRIFNVTVNNITGEVYEQDGVLNAVQSGAVYQWIDCVSGAPINSATNQAFTPTTPGSYGVLVFTAQNCSIVSECIDMTDLSVDGIFANMAVYPNPVSSTLSIVNIPSESTISVVDLSGKVVYQKIADTIENIDVTDFNAGIYFLNVVNKSGNTTQKIVVSK